MSPSIYLEAPILAAVAVFCWLTPIAMVFPPSALIVDLDVFTIDTTLNVSVFHEKNLTRGSNYVSNIWFLDPTDGTSYSSPYYPAEVLHLETCFSRW